MTDLEKLREEVAALRKEVGELRGGSVVDGETGRASGGWKVFLKNLWQVSSEPHSFGIGAFDLYSVYAPRRDQ